MTAEPQIAPTLRVESFTAAQGSDLSGEGAFAAWLEGVRFGFHQARVEPDDVPALAEAYDADGRILWGAYDDNGGTHAWDPRIPVATYATMVNSLNVGGGRLLDAHLVTSVTVRPTHRRKGLLRRMITQDLQGAADRGLAIAALTASEATIYGRFGFGAAALTTSVEVDVRERFELTAPSYGRMEVVEPRSAVELADAIFAGFHARARGSVGRQYSYARMASGLWGEERPRPDNGLRTAVHYDDDGRPDAYVSYKFNGWDSTPTTVRVKDLVAVSDAAYLEIWRYLGSLDLIDRVTFHAAPVQDPLPWALSDRRCRTLKSDEDALWLRILDPLVALETRFYESDGTLTVRVADALRHAAGTFKIVAEAGSAVVSRLEEGTQADIDLDVSALGSLYLGGVDATILASAGRISASSPDALGLADRLFGVARQPYCVTHF
ncbi:GNAT family N-acetyltransferase [Arthrobacter sp. JZ12]|uniref:GNAT family N-acetyltransferase n=1 Tax=Arthrobacter sp. JZ12 TaxID=2654190 RepID=UPI002B486F79|nr:GNAT family N-acetyltransferase [Arthrobacter sp. JZ12]WRH24877.1 GNAT family N-acetyltransferase [Arthrobacter sp. JZ12]